MKKKILIFFAFLLWSSIAYSQPYTLWMNNYAGNLFQEFESLSRTSDGGIIAVGRTQVGDFFNYSDIWVVKTDSWGDTLWTKEIGDIWGNFDAGTAIQETPDRGLIVLGRIGFPCNDSDAWLIKLDSLGNHEWDKTYLGLDGVQAGRTLVQTDDGGFAFSSFFHDTAASSDDIDVLVIKTNSEGDTIWTKTIGGQKRDQIEYISKTNDGGFLLTGRSNSFSSDTLNYGDLWLIRLDSNGNTLWEKFFNLLNGPDLGHSGLELPDGNFIIGGATSDPIAIDYDAWILKVDTNGDTLWTRTYGGIIRESAQSVIRTTDNYLVFTGFTNSPLLSSGNADVWLVKIDSIGDTIWTKAVGDSLDDLGKEIIGFNGGYVVAGYSRKKNISNDDTHTEGLLIRFGEARSRLAIRDLTAFENELIEVPIIFNYPLELSFNSVDISISGYSSNLTFLGINESGAAVGENGWSFEEIISDTSFSVTLSGEIALSAMDTLFYADFVVKEFTEESITIRINSAQIDSGAIPLEIYAGEVLLLPVVGVDSENSSLPEKFSLHQNYPNPFNPVTTISFDLSASGYATLIIYEILGREVGRLVDEDLNQGKYSYQWDASSVASGIYFYTLTVISSRDEFTETKKMLLIK